MDSNNLNNQVQPQVPPQGQPQPAQPVQQPQYVQYVQSVNPNAQYAQPQVPPNAQYAQPQVPPNAQYAQPQVPPNAQYAQQVPPNAQYAQPQVPPNAQYAQQVPPNAQYAQQVPPNVQYAQVPPNAQYVQPQQPVQPEPNKKLERLLCILSLCLHFIPTMIGGGLTYIMDIIGSGNTDFTSILYSVVYSIGSAGYIASWVLMIIARVKFKKSVFAKVLMWVYIGILAVTVVAVALVVITCYNAIKDCPG